MPKFTVFFVCGATLITAAAFSADDVPEKTKMSTVAPAESLTTAANQKIAALQKYVADSDTFEKSAKNLKRDAGMLAVLAQAIAEHDEESPLKKSAVPLRDAALKLAAATSQEGAAQALQAVTQAQSGQASGGELQHEWAELIDFDSLMSEIGQRNRNVGRAVRQMRRGLDQEARNEAALDADMLALLGLVVEADTYGNDDEESMAGWKKYAVLQRETAAQTASAFRNDDAKTLKFAYDGCRESCSGCHKDFR